MKVDHRTPKDLLGERDFQPGLRGSVRLQLQGTNGKDMSRWAQKEPPTEKQMAKYGLSLRKQERLGQSRLGESGPVAGN